MNKDLIIIVIICTLQYNLDIKIKEQKVKMLKRGLAKSLIKYSGEIDENIQTYIIEKKEQQKY